MSDGTYNGWTNRATWAVFLHIGQDMDLAIHWTQEARRHYRANGDTRQRAASLAEQLKQDLMDSVPEVSEEFTDMHNDLLTGAFSDVNWYEIANHMIEDCDK